jgi:integrase
MHIEKRHDRSGKVSYRVRIVKKGYPLQSKTFPTKLEAERWGKQCEADLISGRLGSRQAHHHTLSEAIDRFREERPSGYGEWLHQPRSRMILSWWQERMGLHRLAELKPTNIVQARSMLQRTPSAPKGPHRPSRPRSAATVNRYLSGLSAVLQASLELWGWIESNPCRGIKRIRENNARTRFLTPEEQERLLDACKEDGALHAVVKLALLTGARRGELCNLRWSDVDLEEATLTFWKTKNGEIRTLPLCEEALSLLRERSRSSLAQEQEWVFPAERSVGAIDVSHRFKRFALRAGLKDCRFHDLRHSAASALARAGVAERQIQEILGHKTAQMTKRYSHLRPSDLREAVAVLGASLTSEEKSS